MFKNIFLLLVSIFSIYFLINLFLLIPYFLPAGDDLFGAKQLLDKGFWGMNSFIFMSWDARYTATFLSSSFFYLGGLNHYWLSGLFLLIVSFFSYYFLFAQIIPAKTEHSQNFFYRHWRLFSFTLVFLVSYLAISKPGATGGANFVLVGQFLYNAGSYCYQTSLILSCLILGLLIQYFRDFNKAKFALIIFLLFLLAGTNEGTAILILLIFLYGLYQTSLNPIFLKHKINSSYLNTWILLFLALFIFMVLVIKSPGDQARILYYQLKPDQFPGTYDFVLSTGFSIWQTFFLLFYFLINPLSWLLAIIFYPELKAFRLLRQKLLPREDYFLIYLGLIFIGFFLVAWEMACFAPPRYYGVMATFGFFLVLDVLVSLGELIKLKIGFLNKNYFLIIFQIILFLILIVFNQTFIPVLSDLIKSRPIAQKFDQTYFSIIQELKTAQKQGQKEIVLRQDQLLPRAPILDYFIAVQNAHIQDEVTEDQRRASLAKDLAVYYGVDTVLLESQDKQSKIEIEAPRLVKKS